MRVFQVFDIWVPVSGVLDLWSCHFGLRRWRGDPWFLLDSDLSMMSCAHMLANVVNSSACQPRSLAWDVRYQYLLHAGSKDARV